MEKGLARRCCICKTVQINGEYFPWNDNFDIIYDFSDGYFSKKCAMNFYGESFAELFLDIKLELEECPFH